MRRVLVEFEDQRLEVLMDPGNAIARVVVDRGDYDEILMLEQRRRGKVYEPGLWIDGRWCPLRWLYRMIGALPPETPLERLARITQRRHLDESP